MIHVGHLAPAIPQGAMVNFPTPSLGGGILPPLSTGQILGSAVIQHPSEIAGSVIIGSASSSKAASTGTSQTSVFLVQDNEPQQSVPMKSERSITSSLGSGKGSVLVIKPQNEEEVEIIPEGAEPDPIPNHVEGGDDPPKGAKEEEEEDASGFSMKEVQDLCWKKYEQDTLWAKLVRGWILGLPEGQLPTREQIDASENFALHPPQPQLKEGKDKVNMIDVHSHWLSYIEEEEALGDCPPKEFEPPGEWPKLYTAEGLKEYVPEAVEKWGKGPLLSLIVLVNHRMALIPKYHLLGCLYNMEALKKGLISAGKERTQFACCPTCGVRGENQESMYSHMRRHLHYELLCESCLELHTFTTGYMNKHVEACEAAIALRAGPLSTLDNASSGSGAAKAKPSESLKNAHRGTRKNTKKSSK